MIDLITTLFLSSLYSLLFFLLLLQLLPFYPRSGGTIPRGTDLYFHHCTFSQFSFHFFFFVKLFHSELYFTLLLLFFQDPFHVTVHHFCLIN